MRTTTINVVCSAMLLWNQGGLDSDATCCPITLWKHRALQLFETTLLTGNRPLTCGLPESVRVKPFHWMFNLTKRQPPFFSARQLVQSLFSAPAVPNPGLSRMEEPSKELWNERHGQCAGFAASLQYHERKHLMDTNSTVKKSGTLHLKS